MHDDKTNMLHGFSSAVCHGYLNKLNLFFSLLLDASRLFMAQRSFLHVSMHSASLVTVTMLSYTLFC